MRRYLDTSLIVAALVRESGTESAKAYLSDARDEFLLASRWAVTELLHLAVCKRTGARLATFDNGMATAARRHDLPCDLLAA